MSLSQYAQYRPSAFADASSLQHRPWPPSPTLVKNQSIPRCPLILVALPFFLLMTAAPLLSAIFRPHSPPQFTPMTRPTTGNTAQTEAVAANRHVFRPSSVTADTRLPPPSTTASTAAFACSPDVTVHVVFSNHLDVGFRAYNPEGWFAADVVDQALNQWIPDAITAAANLSSATAATNPHNDTYTWTTHPWLLSLALDCPPHMRFQCPNATAVAALQQAITAGVITFHAFPFNAEAETYNTALFDFGIQLTHDLADRLNKPGGRPAVISQRDVPGVTRAVIPVMHGRSVRGFSIGSNPAATPPDVASAFVWKYDEKSEESPSIVVLYHKGNYGGLEYSDAVIIDGFQHVILFDWNADNAGPYTAQQVLDDLTYVRGQFPNCSVKTSTLDAYVSALWSAVENRTVVLPSYTEEMGDTWIHGMAADPVKVAKTRAVQRLRSECIADEQCDSTSYEFYNFSRLLLKAGEHTHGADVSELFDAPDTFDGNSSYYLWSNEGLARGLQRAEYHTLIDTWREQRSWSIDIPLSALPPSHTIRQKAHSEFDSMRAKPVELSGWKAVGTTRGTNVSGGGWEMGVGSEGSVEWLAHKASGRVYASPGVNALGRLVYQAWTEGDQNEFVREYCYISPENNTWVGFDYGQTTDRNLSTLPHVSRRGKKDLDRVVQPNITRHEPAILVQAYTRSSPQPDTLSLYVHTRLPTYTTTTYGGWQSAWSLITLNTSSAAITITLTLYNKTATRIPESPAFIFSFRQPHYPVVHKLSTAINTSHIFSHGSHHLHGVSEVGVEVEAWATVASKDVALVGLGDRVSAFPVPWVLDGSGSGGGGVRQVYFVLSANVWGTNYVEWFPFLPEDRSVQYRFDVALHTGDGSCSSSGGSGSGSGGGSVWEE